MRLLHARHDHDRACALSEEPDCDAERIRDVLSGNLCRCTGYIPIVEAVLDARAAYSARRARHETLNTYIGSPVERVEDLRFLRGRGAICRRPRRARTCCTRRSCAARSRTAASARSTPPRRSRMPGVHAVITAARYRRQRAARSDAAAAAAGVRALRAALIADDKVRYVGEPIALVLADSAGSPRTRVDAIELDIEPLPAVADRHAAASDEVAAVRGDGHQPARSVPRRARRCRRRRSASAPMCGASSFSTAAPHGAAHGAARPAGGVGRQAQAPHRVGRAPRCCSSTAASLAKQMGLPEDAIDIIENDVGGGFGARGEFYPEDFLIPFAARHFGRPVKWMEDRREHLMAMNHAREADCDVEIACARDGTILGLRGHAYVDIGAYMRTNGAVGARNVAQFMSGPYRIPNIDIDVAAAASPTRRRSAPIAGPAASRPTSSASACSTWRRRISASIASSSAASNLVTAGGDALPARAPCRRASSTRPNSTAATIASRSTAASQEFDWARSRSCRAN